MWNRRRRTRRIAIILRSFFISFILSERETNVSHSIPTHCHRAVCVCMCPRPSGQCNFFFYRKQSNHFLHVVDSERTEPCTISFVVEIRNQHTSHYLRRIDYRASYACDLFALALLWHWPQRGELFHFGALLNEFWTGNASTKKKNKPINDTKKNWRKNDEKKTNIGHWMRVQHVCVCVRCASATMMRTSTVWIMNLFGFACERITAQPTVLADQFQLSPIHSRLHEYFVHCKFQVFYDSLGDLTTGPMPNGRAHIAIGRVTQSDDGMATEFSHFHCNHLNFNLHTNRSVLMVMIRRFVHSCCCWRLLPLLFTRKLYNLPSGKMGTNVWVGGDGGRQSFDFFTSFQQWMVHFQNRLKLLPLN